MVETTQGSLFAGTTAPVTLADYQAFVRRVDGRAARVREMIVARARAEAERAGLDPSIAFLHAHNAMVSRECGSPWAGVDYARVRRVLWLEKRSWEPNRLATAVTDRVWRRFCRLQGWGMAVQP